MTESQKPIVSLSAFADLSGRQLGDFRLLRSLGQGAMAQVYLAEQCQLKRMVAVKVLKPELARDETYLRRFEREARAAAALVHANIVQVYEVGRQDGLHYIAQEYVEGQNLRDWVVRNGPPDMRQALSIMWQVAAALAKAADQGVVHRDIKPENIMITRSGEVKVADFGLARFAHESEASDLTQAGITMGTPLYMSPEQVEGRSLDPRSDIYSFGVTCYHMLSGQPPFTGETALGVAVQHLKSAPKQLDIVRTDLPPALCRIVHKMLAKRPDQRYAHPREVLRELRRLQLELGIDQWPEDMPGWDANLAATAEGRYNATQQLDGLMKTLAVRRPRLWKRSLAIAALLAAAILGGVVAWHTSRETPLLGAATGAHLPLPKQGTALRQWYYASQLGTPEAWQSVIDYYGKGDELLVRRAEQQQAMLYLQQQPYDKAMRLFKKFEEGGETEPELYAFGLAGEAVVQTLDKKFDEAAQTLSRLRPNVVRLQNSQLRRRLESILQTYGKELGEETTRQWASWLETQVR